MPDLPRPLEDQLVMVGQRVEFECEVSEEGAGQMVSAEAGVVGQGQGPGVSPEGPGTCCPPSGQAEGRGGADPGGDL